VTSVSALIEFFSNKQIWKNSPFFTTFLLETANVGQIMRMWTERTAAGQSLTSWICVGTALACWANWYRLFTPEQKIARNTCLFGMLVNATVISTVIYFRYYR
jgi:uncharacterized membrane protein YbaN (DUF454 family)